MLNCHFIFLETIAKVFKIFSNLQLNCGCNDALLCIIRRPSNVSILFTEKMKIVNFRENVHRPIGTNVMLNRRKIYFFCI